MVRQTAKVIILEILVGLVVVSVLALAALAVRLSSGPIELDLFKAEIERALEDGRSGRQVALENVSLEWLRDERRAVITASGLKLYDQENEVAAEAGNAEILLDITDLLTGKVRPIGLELENGWIGVHQSDAGWSVAGDPIGSQQVVNIEQGTIRAQDLLETINQALMDVLNVLRRDAEILPLQHLRFEDVDIVFTESEIGERVRFTKTLGGFSRDENGISLDLSGSITADEDGPDRISASLIAPASYTQIEAEIIFEDLLLESVANIFPALLGTVTELPSNLVIGLSANAQTGLENVSFQSSAGAGTVRYGGATLDVSEFDLAGQYYPERDDLFIQLENLNIAPVRGDLDLQINQVLGAEGARPFSLTSRQINLDLKPRFSESWRADRLKGAGSINISDRSVKIDALSLQVDDATLRVSGEVTALGNLQGRDLPVETDISAEVTGTLLPEQFIRFWPVRQAPGARAYVMRIIKEGYITGARAQLDLRRDSFSQGHLADEALSADFSVANARVRPLPDIPDVQSVNAVGRMTGNSMRITFEDARIGKWAIDKGEVHYPRLSPAGFDMTISLEGHGQAEDLMRIVSESRLQLQARTGLDPATVSGHTQMAFTMIRPARPMVPLSDYRYTGTGTVKAGGLAEAFNGLSLIESDANVALNEKGIQITGLGKISDAPIKYDWSYEFNGPLGGDNKPALLKATSVLTPDILNAFGIVGRAYLTGEAPVEFEALLDGARLRSIDAAFDLLGARLDLAEVNWIKPVGQAGTASLRYNVNDGAPVTDVALNTDGAAFDGTFTLAENGRLLSGNIERAFLENRADVSGTASRTQTGALQFDIGAKFLDLSRFIPDTSSFGGASDTMAARFGDIVLNADVETLRLREGFETLQTHLSMVSSKDGIQTLEAKGLLPNSAEFDAAYDASGLGDPTFLINSGDASFLASVFLGLDSLEAGTLQMSGTFATGDLPTQMRLVIDNGRLKEAPFVTQILSLASIKGLSDTLAGEGVLFTRIEVPLTIANGRYNIVGARASGPALGLTANGSVTPSTGAIDVDGVLVPSFGVNSALGGIPVIGNLFVSREGEGVISLRYGIEGTLEKAQVSVNPLSAITPGIIRRIFESPADADLSALGDESDENARGAEPPASRPDE